MTNTLKAETLRALAETRVRQYLDERRLMRGLDFQQIHGLHTGTDRECELLASDLRVLLEADKDERVAALEECAKIADDEAARNDRIADERHRSDTNREAAWQQATASRRIAKAIRALGKAPS